MFKNDFKKYVLIKPSILERLKYERVDETPLNNIERTFVKLLKNKNLSSDQRMRLFQHLIFQNLNKSQLINTANKQKSNNNEEVDDEIKQTSSSSKPHSSSSPLHHKAVQTVSTATTTNPFEDGDNINLEDLNNMMGVNNANSIQRSNEEEEQSFDVTMEDLTRKMSEIASPSGQRVRDILKMKKSLSSSSPSPSPVVPSPIRNRNMSSSSTSNNAIVVGGVGDESMDFDLNKSIILDDVRRQSVDKTVKLSYEDLSFRHLEDPSKKFFVVENTKTGEVLSIDKEKAVLQQLEKRGLKRIASSPLDRDRVKTRLFTNTIKWTTYPK